MNAAGIIAELQASGAELTANGERLRYKAPPGLLTPELRAFLVEHKTEIIAHLQRRQADAARLLSLVAMCGYCGYELQGRFAVTGGRDNWEAFAKTAPDERIARALACFEDICRGYVDDANAT